MTQPWSNQAVSLIVIIAGGGFTGLFVYSPTPAAGNLIDSIAPAGGTDPYGNTYLSGITSYGPLPGGGVGTKVATSLTAGGVETFTAPSSAGAYAGHAQVYYSLTGAAHVALTTPVATDLVQLGGDTAGVAKLTVNGQWPFATSGASSMFGQLMAQQLADFTTHTVTQATSTQLSTSFTIPANDAEVGAVYELEAQGTGTNSATAVTAFQFNQLFGGTQQQTLGSISAGAAGNAISFHIVSRVACVTTGSSGTWLATLFGEWSVTGLGSTGNTFAFTSSTSSAFTLNTTVAQALVINGQWASVTNAPTVTCRQTQFRRVA